MCDFVNGQSSVVVAGSVTGSFVNTCSTTLDDGLYIDFTKMMQFLLAAKTNETKTLVKLNKSQLC